MLCRKNKTINDINCGLVFTGKNAGQCKGVNSTVLNFFKCKSRRFICLIKTVLCKEKTSKLTLFNLVSIAKGDTPDGGTTVPREKIEPLFFWHTCAYALMHHFLSVFTLLCAHMLKPSNWPAAKRLIKSRKTRSPIFCRQL